MARVFSIFGLGSRTGLAHFLTEPPLLDYRTKGSLRGAGPPAGCADTAVQGAPGVGSLCLPEGAIVTTADVSLSQTIDFSNAGTDCPIQAFLEDPSSVCVIPR
jgi:hypothetical protein